MADQTPSDLELWLLEPAASKVFPLPARGSLVIGRAPGSEILIDDPSVSRRHARLELGDTIQVEDLGSANGTWLHSETKGSLLQASAHGPLSTRPGLIPVSAGQPRSLSIGQGWMVGAMLLVVRRRTAQAPTATAGASPWRAPALSDPRMKALYATAERVAVSPLSVLILGETGVGKEILAEAIHRHSQRAHKPFMRIHCASLSSALLESELFGHEQGAFTGAVRAKQGLLQVADGGTIFLDEIGELPLDFQVKLLRFLEDRTLTRVGGVKPIQVDVRFVAATHRELRQQVAQGRFREDLLYRLDGISLVIPPLRERPSEIAPLATLFALEASRALGMAKAPTLAEESMASLLRQPWPGNVRELRHLIERAVVLCQGDTILPSDLMPSAGSWPGSSVPAAESPAGLESGPELAAAGSLRDEIAGLERQRIEEALERSGGNQSRAAELLGISRRTLVTRLETFGLPRPRKPSTR